MSGDDLSDSQNLSKSISLLSDRDTSATETDSMFDSDETESSVTSRPPPENIYPDKMPEQEVPVINLSDEGSPVLNNAGDLDNEDPSLSQDLEANPIVPKIYISFLSDVVDRSSSVLSEEDRAAVEWLRKQKNVVCCALLENEDNPAELQTLLGSMPPKSQTTKTMDVVAMLKALRAKEKKAKATEKNTASSVECLGTDPVQGDGGNPSAQRKKQKIDDGGNPGGASSKPPPSGSIQNTTGNTLPNLTSGSSEKWWTLFNDFEGATSDVGSIFDRRFPVDQIVEKHLNRKEDRTRDSLLVELEDIKAQVAMQHTAGFDKAVSQLQFLYLDLKVDEVGAFKHVVDGKLVDIFVDEDEE
ncbi:hypothetical protein SESBI_15213 [Sesbania bispinosa]|nr:hypothetical protein SESBI_15213 [Sesbania bispinosa]